MKGLCLMRIDIEFGSKFEVNARFGDFVVKSDQSKEGGGESCHPEPFDYFLASMALCAGYYVKAFCESRGLLTEGIKIYQEDVKDSEDKYKRMITLKIEVPTNFPTKYLKAIEMAAKNCTVKKVIEHGPQFSIEVLPAS